MDTIYHPPTHIVHHPFPHPAPLDVQRNQDLCASPPKKLHKEEPFNTITLVELNRILPRFPYTVAQWLNDAIISTMLHLMHQCSPFNKDRYAMPTYFSKRARDSPTQTVKYFNTPQSRNRHKKHHHEHHSSSSQSEQGATGTYYSAGNTPISSLSPSKTTQT